MDRPLMQPSPICRQMWQSSSKERLANYLEAQPVRSRPLVQPSRSCRQMWQSSSKERLANEPEAQPAGKLPAAVQSHLGIRLGVCASVGFHVVVALPGLRVR